jgi:hypothetical protein
MKGMAAIAIARLGQATDEAENEKDKHDSGRMIS